MRIDALKKWLGIQGMRFLYWRLPSWVERMSYTPALNYGYKSEDGDFSFLPEQVENRVQLRLYHLIATPFLSERDARHPIEIAEVGCGLGVRASWLSSLLGDGLSTLYGIDGSEAAVDFCRRRYAGDPKLSFQQGNASYLSLEDESVDIVLNVESSHMYPDMPGFVAESYRILKPGGYFLWADFRGADRQEETVRTIAEKFDILQQEDITAGVLRALESEKEEERKEEYLFQLLSSLRLPERIAVRLSLKYVRNFMGMKGSGIAHDFQAGNLVYLRVAAQKAAS